MRTLVENTLKQLEPEIKYTQDSAELGLGTIAKEGDYGKYRRQLGNGPALGIAQMEPFTFNDCVDNFLKFRKPLADKIKLICGIDHFNASDLEFNDKLAICMMRVKYMRDSKPIPSNLEGWALYWKRVYNSENGKGTPEEFIQKYKYYVLNEK